VIDVVKVAIKDPAISAVYKFNALLLLKESSKSNSRTFVEYLDKKLLLRLYKMACISLAKDCLKEYCKSASQKDAERFYQLLMECFHNWGGMFKDISRNFLKFAQDLSNKRKLPVKKEFWTFPNDLVENARDHSYDHEPAHAYNYNDNISPINTSGISNNRRPGAENNAQQRTPAQQNTTQLNKSGLDQNSETIANIGKLNRVHD
jgi:hypothetical protein